MGLSSKNLIWKGCIGSTLICEYVTVPGTTYPALATLPGFLTVVKNVILLCSNRK